MQRAGVVDGEAGTAPGRNTHRPTPSKGSRRQVVRTERLLHRQRSWAAELTVRVGRRRLVQPACISVVAALTRVQSPARRAQEQVSVPCRGLHHVLQLEATTL